MHFRVRRLSRVSSVALGGNTIPIVLDRAHVPSLDTMRVLSGTPVLMRYAAVAARRRRGDATASISREEIEKRNPVSLWQMLTRVPSVSIVDSVGLIVATYERAMFFRVAIDGMLQSQVRVTLANLPPPSEIYAIEVFSRVATVPVQYN